MSAAEYRALGLPPIAPARAPAAPRPVADNEGPVHRSVLDVLRLRLGSRYLVQHTPNRPRSQVQGGREKRLGAVRGWPDLAVYGPGPVGPACWFAEIKPPGAPVPRHQREVHARLQAAGFEVWVLRGIEDAETALAAWGIPTRTRPGVAGAKGIDVGAVGPDTHPSRRRSARRPKVEHGL